MNKTLRNGLGAIVGLGIASISIGTESCAEKKEVYDILNGKCRQTSCGEVCYEGLHGEMIHAKIDRKYKGFPVENIEINIGECKLPVVDVTDDMLVLKNWE